ncbi:CLAVATA3/ESR (CLE)-related protein 9-like [Eucalyptus grandis]|uniref:CLAVATA3/ESR (CLE)-related protein 9-like n=1 Tax=Eucalyptus grandis TaxID=71139 RepID=UPI00192EF240|nr:CLAVATA3/ESR (CLE)-related protein 9-like [Eucalyptus grandis]
MKRPSSSSSSLTPCNSATSTKFLILTLLLCLHPVMSTSAVTSAMISRSSSSFGKSWRSHDSHHHHHHHLLHHSCDPSSGENPPHYTSSLCFHLEQIRRRRQPPPPPPPDEIDPRYGVNKRLVPSGPNPLHN